MISRWEIVILFIAGFIILLYGYVYKFSPDPNSVLDGTTLMSVTEILDKADNGDLIFFSGNTFGERSIKWYHNSVWSHCGIIIRDLDNDKDPLSVTVPYILESDLGQNHKDGPRVMRLKDKFERWKGHDIVGWRRYIGIRPPKNEMLVLAESYVNLDFDKSLMSWFFSDDPKSRIYKYFKDNSTIFCSELVADILQKLRILEKDHEPSWYTPGNFASGQDITLKKGFFSSLEIANLNSVNVRF